MQITNNDHPGTGDVGYTMEAKYNSVTIKSGCTIPSVSLQL